MEIPGVNDDGELEAVVRVLFKGEQRIFTPQMPLNKEKSL